MNKSVIISPYSRGMRNGRENPKNYPYWPEVIRMLRQNGLKTIQVGGSGEAKLDCDDFQFNLPLAELTKLLLNCDTWISVDNFFNHFATYHKKRGVVIFGKSDPKLFGYPQNINLLKDRKYLRQHQWEIWEAEVFDASVFVTPFEVTTAIFQILSGQ